MIVRLTLLMLVAGFGASSANAETLVTLGINSSGDEILIDRDSLRTVGRGEYRSFSAVQVRAVQRFAARRREASRDERMLFSFNCSNRTSAMLSYLNGRSGTRRQDWTGADSEFRYAAPRSGSVAEVAMIFACSGGRLPSAPAATASSDDDEAQTTP